MIIPIFCALASTDQAAASVSGGNRSAIHAGPFRKSSRITHRGFRWDGKFKNTPPFANENLAKGGAEL
jgi:hypothetical protein